MTTVTDIVEEIKSDLVLSGSDYDAQLVRAVQTALRELRGRRFWFLETFGTLTATASSETIEIASTYSDFGALKSIDLIADSRRYYNRLGFDLLKFDLLRERYWTNGTIETGQPKACALLGKSTLKLSHKAGSAYSLPIVYYKQDATIPGAGGTSVWFDDGIDVVRSRAQYIFKRDAQGMTLQESDGDMVLMAERALSDAHLSMIVGESY